MFLQGLINAQNDSLFYNKVEVKLNIPAALVMIPNIGVEVKLNDKFSYQLDTNAVS